MAGSPNVIAFYQIAVPSWKTLTKALVGRTTIDEHLLDVLEETLLGADVGIEQVLLIIERLKARVQQHKYVDQTDLFEMLKIELLSMCPAPTSLPLAKAQLNVLFLVGVNGVGKTTTAAKLAHYYQQQGWQVSLGAADTFRAAAIEQLTNWATRLGCPIVARQTGADATAVAYDAIAQARTAHHDLVIVDTAGRLHTKTHLMQQLTRMHRTAHKAAPKATLHTWLTLDATTGQNAQIQANLFNQATQLNGLVLTKLDGTAKGGVVFGLAQQLPIHFVGTGEGIDDLKPFDPQQFVSNFLPQS